MSEQMPRSGFVSTVKAVLWSFVGIRKRKDYHDDASSLDPKAIIAAGVLAGLVFVLTIVAVVNWVLS